MNELKRFLRAWDRNMAFMAPPDAPSGGVLQSIVWFGPIVVIVVTAISAALT